MISAKLAKYLEQKGFMLDFPGYESNEQIAIDILKEENERLYPAIPLLLQEEFDYEKIIKRTDKKLIRRLNKVILIAAKLFKSEGINNVNIFGIVKRFKIKGKITENEFKYYYDSFKEAKQKQEAITQGFLKGQILARKKLTLNKALSDIFAPAKMRIMEKIINHEKLTNTELKYYYRSIRPLALAILDEDLRGYLSIVEAAKKIN